MFLSPLSDASFHQRRTSLKASTNHRPLSPNFDPSEVKNGKMGKKCINQSTRDTEIERGREGERLHSKRKRKRHEMENETSAGKLWSRSYETALSITTIHAVDSKLTTVTLMRRREHSSSTTTATTATASLKNNETQRLYKGTKPGRSTRLKHT